MKTKYLLIVLTISAVFFGCKKETEYRDVLLIAGTETNNAVRVAIETAPYNVAALKVSATTKVNNDLEVDLAIDNSLVAEYNNENGTDYQVLPDGSYDLEHNAVTIKAGTSISDPVGVRIKDLTDFKDGKTYLLPVVIKNAKGELGVLESSRTVYYIINRTIITNAADISAGFFKIDFSGKPEQVTGMKTLTYEARINAKGFMNSSPYISTIMGIEEHFLLRFGDVTVAKDKLQFARWGVSMAANTACATDVWYHIALTYDGNSLKLYINGKLDASSNLPGMTANMLDANGFFIGKSTGGATTRSRGFNGTIGEVRLWNRALTPAEIQAGMCAVDPASSGLLGYWKLNEGSGTVCSDLSGNGYTATGVGTIKWVTGLRCPE